MPSDTTDRAEDDGRLDREPAPDPDATLIGATGSDAPNPDALIEGNRVATTEDME